MSSNADDHGTLAASIFPKGWDWQPPSTYQKITTIDTHTGGEPLRIPISGLPPIYGNNVLEKRRYFMKNYDHLRTGLLLEPRGHADMYGAILTTSEDPKVDLDCIFLNTDGYSPMCGHGTLAVTKVAFETGLLKKEGSIKCLNIAVPAGLLYAKAFMAEDGTVTKTSFRNVPSFVYLRDQKVSISELGIEVQFDIVFGGAFYAIVDAQPLGLILDAGSYSILIRYGRAIKKGILASSDIKISIHSKKISAPYSVSFLQPLLMIAKIIVETSMCSRMVLLIAVRVAVE